MCLGKLDVCIYTEQVLTDHFSKPLGCLGLVIPWRGCRAKTGSTFHSAHARAPQTLPTLWGVRPTWVSAQVRLCRLTSVSSLRFARRKNCTLTKKVNIACSLLGETMAVLK